MRQEQVPQAGLARERLELLDQRARLPGIAGSRAWQAVPLRSELRSDRCGGRRRPSAGPAAPPTWSSVPKACASPDFVQPKVYAPGRLGRTTARARFNRRRRSARFRPCSRAAPPAPRTEPSACWWFSSTATSVRPTARPEPLSVCTSSGLPCPGAESRLHPPRLEGLAVGHRRDLAVGTLPGQPHFEVEGLCRRRNPCRPCTERARGKAAAGPAGSPRHGRPSRRAPRTIDPGVVTCTISTLSN